MENRRHANLRRFLNPASVALIGGRTLAPTIHILKLAGYTGPIRVVNPSRAEIGGIVCVPSVAELPEPPDAVFIAVNRRATVEAVAALARAGAGGAICFAAGFAELGGEGRRLETALAAAAGDMVLVGPNSNGLLNRLDRVALWPMVDHDPVAMKSGVAIIAQSGGIAQIMMRDMRGLRPAVIASTGNQTLVGPADWIEVLAADPRIAAIGLFLEDAGDIAGLTRAAETARARGLPVVVLKSGRSALGAEMAATHTGAMAGEDVLFEALCERLGFVRVRSVALFAETLKALEAWGGLTGTRLVVATASGAARALFADAAVEAGLSLSPFSDRLVAELRPQLPEFAHISKPLDHNAAYTGMLGLTLENEPALQECFRTVLSDGFDVALMHSDWTEYGPDGSPAMRAWARAARAAGTPAGLATLLPDSMSADAQAFCRKWGLAAMQGLEDTVAAIAACARFARFRDGPAGGGLALPEPTPLHGPRRVIDEWRAKERLEAAGIAFPRRVRAGPGEIALAATRLGFPVVLKAISAQLAHKHRAGAVAVGLGDTAAVTQALERMQVALDRAGIAADGFLVEEMVADAQAELIVGIKTSPVYGMALVLGAGGVDAERIGDATALLLPATQAAIVRAISGLRIAARLGPEALAALAVKVADFAEMARGDMVALDLNPVIVTAGGRVVAVDALIEEVAAP